MDLEEKATKILEGQDPETVLELPRARGPSGSDRSAISSLKTVTRKRWGRDKVQTPAFGDVGGVKITDEGIGFTMKKRTDEGVRIVRLMDSSSGDVIDTVEVPSLEPGTDQIEDAIDTLLQRN